MRTHPQSVGPGADVTSVDDMRRLLAGDARLGGWRVIDRSVDYLEIEQREVFLVLLWPALWQRPEALEPHLVRARSGNYGIVLFGTDVELAAGPPAGPIETLDAPHIAVMPVPAPAGRIVLGLRQAYTFGCMQRDAAEAELDLDRARYEHEMLISVGRALSQQRDLRSLLDIILRRAREASGADAGSIYVVEGDDDDDVRERKVHFKVAQNDSVESVATETTGFSMPVSNESIVGLCVLTADEINIPDLYELDPPGVGNNPWGFIHDRSFDERHGYQTRSMLTVPMISARQQVIGVIQLINKRARGVAALSVPGAFRSGVVPFDDVSVAYTKSLASQAGIALENAMLNEEVKTLFEGFVRASVTAIEARDPTTSGHSERVARLTTGLARVTDRVDTGPYAHLRFTTDEMTQLEYAALLHDFGKVGVREHVLVKAEKLYPMERALIEQRFQYIKKTIESETLSRKVDYLLEASRERAVVDLEAMLGGIDRDAGERLAELDGFVRFVLEANRPTVLAEGKFEHLTSIAALRYLDGDGRERPYLTPGEVEALGVLRGSLTREERAEIESHVVHTFNFLQQIPWGRTYRRVPQIAGAHHEKLDGSGYPNGISGAGIPVPARMMTISDIYDALTASDRPYKKAVPVERALDILGMEVKDGRLDADLYRIFVEARVFDLTRPRPPTDRGDP
ncbi:HD domain-containing phosphohydrolase [Haliangium sp.]|uniref:HD domain-containing phosphohydrolase n=1 Tax=Haliangium sp. TaxID=2663208 RepID=UPI003D09CAB1